MQTVTLKCRESRQTIIENMFIDHHMAKANGEYVKVYLLPSALSAESGFTCHDRLPCRLP